MGDARGVPHPGRGREDEDVGIQNLLPDARPRVPVALIDLTTQAAVESPDQVATCIKDVQFKKWVADAQARALNGPIPNSNVDKVKGTPTVIVNGLKYEGSVSDLASFQAFVIQAAGTDFNQNSTPTPTPTPTATPAG